MISTNDSNTPLAGKHRLSADGDKVGSIGQIYLDDQTGDPRVLHRQALTYTTRTTGSRTANPTGGSN